MGVLGIATIDDIKERALDFFSDRSTTSYVIVFAHRNTVEFANRCDFSSSSGEESLVGDIHLITGDALLYDLNSKILCNMEHGIAGDATQSASRKVWRINHTVFNNEDVLARTF